MEINIRKTRDKLAPMSHDRANFPPRRGGVNYGAIIPVMTTRENDERENGVYSAL